MMVDRKMAEHLATLNDIENVYVRRNMQGKWNIHLMVLRGGHLQSFILQKAQFRGRKDYATLDAAERDVASFWVGTFTVYRDEIPDQDEQKWLDEARTYRGWPTT